jgi:hypothetical protein
LSIKQKVRSNPCMAYSSTIFNWFVYYSMIRRICCAKAAWKSVNSIRNNTRKNHRGSVFKRSIVSLTMFDLIFISFLWHLLHFSKNKVRYFLWIRFQSGTAKRYLLRCGY